jgi:hypothetical protein
LASADEEKLSIGGAAPGRRDFLASTELEKSSIMVELVQYESTAGREHSVFSRQQQAGHLLPQR